MIEQILAYFKKLQGRDRIIVAVAVLFALANIYMQILYKPAEKALKQSKAVFAAKTSALNNLIDKRKSHLHQKDEFESIKQDYAESKKELDRIEALLPNKDNVSQLIAELANIADGLTFISLRQKIEMLQKYPQFVLELKFTGDFQHTMDYLEKMETISPFLKIDQLDIGYAKDKNITPALQITLMLSSLMGDGTTQSALKAKLAKSSFGKVKDIFGMGMMYVSTTTILTSEHKLEGITYNTKTPTAVIDGEVVRIGSQVGKLKVTKITPTEVVLKDDVHEYKLTVTR